LSLGKNRCVFIMQPEAWPSKFSTQHPQFLCPFPYLPTHSVYFRHSQYCCVALNPQGNLNALQFRNPQCFLYNVGENMPSSGNTFCPPGTFLVCVTRYVCRLVKDRIFGSGSGRNVERHRISQPHSSLTYEY